MRNNERLIRKHAPKERGGKTESRVIKPKLVRELEEAGEITFVKVGETSGESGYEDWETWYGEYAGENSVGVLVQRYYSYTSNRTRQYHIMLSEEERKNLKKLL